MATLTATLRNQDGSEAGSVSVECNCTMPVEIDSVRYYNDKGRLVKILFADGRGGFFDKLEHGLLRTDEAIRKARNDDPPGTPPEASFEMPLPRPFAPVSPTNSFLNRFVDTTCPTEWANPPGRYIERVEKVAPKPLPAHHRIHGQRKGKERRW